MNGPQEDKGHNSLPRTVITWVRARWVSLATLLLVVAIILGVFYLHQAHPELVDELSRYGYLGGFLISILLNATIILPAGNFLVLAALATLVPSPTLLGLVGGFGAAIGEMTGYLAGYSGRAMVGNSPRWMRLEGWVNRWGGLAIFALSIVPFAFDIVGIIAGVLRLPLWKFFLTCWWGRTILYVVIAWGGALGWEALLNFWG